MSILSVLGLGACAQQKPTETNLKGKKVLVAYMSWSGNTKAAAERIAEITGGDLFEIERVEPYPTDLDSCIAVSKPESKNNERPAIKGKVENFDQYDVVFVGTPLWWSTCPMPVFTFLEQYDFTGKTVIPFSTAHSSKYNSHKDIVKHTPNATHLEGLELLTDKFQGEGIVSQYKKIDGWLKGMGY